MVPPSREWMPTVSVKRPSRITQFAIATAALAAIGAIFVLVQSQRAGVPFRTVLGGRSDRAASMPAAPTPTRRAPRIDFLVPKPIGDGFGPNDRPLIAHVSLADLDGDGLPDILVADAAKNRIAWLRQSRDGTFTEHSLADVPGPAPVIEAAARALREKSNQYPPGAGLPELREAICGYYARRQGLALAPEDVTVTSGATEAIAAAEARVATPDASMRKAISAGGPDNTPANSLSGCRRICSLCHGSLPAR